jgi:hypothetical protein
VKLPRYRYFLLAGVILGAAMPTYYFIHRALDWRHGIGRPEVLLWPSCIMLGATIGAEESASAYLIIAISIAANIFLYALTASVIWFVLHAVFRRGTPTV